MSKRKQDAYFHSPYPVDWFFLGGAVCLAFVTFGSGSATYGVLTTPSTLPGALVMAWWLLGWVSVPGSMVLLVFVPLYFPDGRLVMRGNRFLRSSQPTTILWRSFGYPR